MEIVIKIDDKLHNRIKYLEPKADTMLDKLMRCVQNGTPLPEHHGRLIDADALPISHGVFVPRVPNRVILGTPMDAVFADEIKDAPTIIEAEGSDAE